MNKLILFIAIILSSPAMLYAGDFQPYKIKAGFSYYSDEYTTSNGLSALGEEKNFEEIYQYYNYYEAVFDSQERIVTFKAYERGAVDFSESYFYDDDGRLVKKEVEKSDGSKSVVTLPAQDAVESQ